MPLTRAQLRRLANKKNSKHNDPVEESTDQQTAATDLSTEKQIQNADRLEKGNTAERSLPRVVPAGETTQRPDDTDGIEDESADEDSEADDDDSDASEADDDSDEENDSDSDASEDDLDELLDKAQKALDLQQQQHQQPKDLEEDESKQVRLPKMDTGINIEKELYIKRDGGAARLKQEAVVMVDDEEKAAKRSVEVVKASKEKEKPKTRKERQQERDKTAGKGWFDMARPEMTPELQRDLQVLKMRHVIDPKRHYRKMGKNEEFKYFQMGTVVEGSTEFFSSRLSRKERKQTIVDELLADDKARTYHKRKHLEKFARTNEGRKKAKRQMKQLSRS